MKNLLAYFWKPKRLAPAEIVFFGLGNPGRRYTGTRHNTGFLVIDALAHSLTDRRTVNACRSRITTGRLPGGRPVALVMPKTFVNRSGEALALVKKAFSLDLPRCMVIADDLNLPIGSLRLRRSGSDGGHNGLKSIIQSVGEGFPRLRIGIGPVSEKEAVMDFVLGDFTKEQKESIGKTVCEAAEACRYFADNTIEKAMNKYNK